MSLLVRYTLADPANHDAQVRAMQALVADLKAAAIAGLNYSCYSTEEPTEFVGVLDFADQAAFEAFQASDGFAAYRSLVGPTFANPPKTPTIAEIASTRG